MTRARGVQIVSLPLMDNEEAIQRFHQLGSLDDVTDGLVSDLLLTSQVLKFVNESTLIRYLEIVLRSLNSSWQKQREEGSNVDFYSSSLS